jgi:hypothetical protein
MGIPQGPGRPSRFHSETRLTEDRFVQPPGPRAIDLAVCGSEARAGVVLSCEQCKAWRHEREGVGASAQYR